MKNKLPIGQFIAEKLAIPKNELSKLLSMQEYMNEKIGEIALLKRLISKKELEKTLDFQKNQGVSFGIAAMYLGCLKNFQVKYLLDVQAQNKYRLGELLIEQGIVSPDKFNEILDDFYKQNKMQISIIGFIKSPLFKDIKQSLKEDCYHLEHCPSEIKLEPLIKKHGPQLILLDHELKKAEKISMKIKESLPSKNITVAYLSAEKQELKSFTGYESGIDYFIPIPFNKKHLVNIVIDTEIQSKEKQQERILIVDDSSIVVESIAEELRGSGFNLLIAKNGKEAIEIATSEKPDLITMDINMPVMDGY